MENKIESVKIENSVKPWVLFMLIIVSVLVPQIVANQFAGDFVFGYPTGGEYQTWSTIAGSAGVFITYVFLKDFHLNKSLTTLLSLLAVVPLIRLIIAVALMLSWGARSVTSQKTTPLLINRFKNIALVFVGYLAIYNFIFGTAGLIFLSAEVSVVSSILRMLISSMFFYFIYKRKIYLSQIDLIGYVIGATVLAYYLFL